MDVPINRPVNPRALNLFILCYKMLFIRMPLYLLLSFEVLVNDLMVDVSLMEKKHNKASAISILHLMAVSSLLKHGTMHKQLLSESFLL